LSLTDRLTKALANGHGRETLLLPGDNLLRRAEGEAIPAAVLVAITDRPEPGVILTQRPETMRKHPGQIAFPGGRMDSTDGSLIAAALREAEEEIALPPSAVSIVGTTDVYRTITGYDVTPVLGVVAPDLRFTPNQGEVEDIFEVPLAHILDPAHHNLQVVDWQGRTRRYYEIFWNERRIWGATAAMIINLSRRLQWQ
jgi:8-oxo-dGTP pyrophosphatase MutT (NUDIX family)